MCNLCIEDWHYSDISTTYRSWLKDILNDQLLSNMNSDKMANKIYFWKTNLIKQNHWLQWMINAWVQCAYLFIIDSILNNQGVCSNICFIQKSCKESLVYLFIMNKCMVWCKHYKRWPRYVLLIVCVWILVVPWLIGNRRRYAQLPTIVPVWGSVSYSRNKTSQKTRTSENKITSNLIGDYGSVSLNIDGWYITCLSLVWYFN